MAQIKKYIHICVYECVMCVCVRERKEENENDNTHLQNVNNI